MTNAALEQQIRPEVDKVFSRYDLDKSGFIDKAEEVDQLTTYLLFTLGDTGVNHEAVVNKMRHMAALKPETIRAMRFDVDNYVKWFLDAAAVPQRGQSSVQLPLQTDGVGVGWPNVNANAASVACRADQGTEMMTMGHVPQEVRVPQDTPPAGGTMPNSGLYEVEGRLHIARDPKEQSYAGFTGPAIQPYIRSGELVDHTFAFIAVVGFLVSSSVVWSFGDRTWY